MKHLHLIQLLLILAFVSKVNFSASAQSAPATDTAPSKFIYADFQNPKDGRPMSANGGQTRLNRYAQNMAAAPKMRGLENADPPTPALARVTESDVAAAFEYELRVPNEWAGVNLEIFGHPEKDGKLIADDVSAYKFMTMRIFAKTARSVRVELITRNHGYNLESGYPFAAIKLSPGFNTYRFKLDSFNQPDWATRLDLKRDVLKKLTSITIGVFCEKCRLESGTVVVDNIAFEN
jgi:hypothetical protein